MTKIKSEKQLGDYCHGCTKGFSHGDRIVLARNLKFFHLNCFGRKNFFYRLFNSVQTYFIWQESHTAIDQLNDSLNKYLSLAIDQKEESDEDGGGDAKAEIHELEISKAVDITMKEEAQNQTSATIMDITLDEERVIEVTDSLMEMRGEVEELKSKIEQFVSQKDFDEQMILQMEKSVKRHIRQINELNMQNYFLRQETLILHQKLKVYEESSDKSYWNQKLNIKDV